MVAIERLGTIQTFNRLPNEWNDEKGYHINFSFSLPPIHVYVLYLLYYYSHLNFPNMLSDPDPVLPTFFQHYNHHYTKEFCVVFLLLHYTSF